MYFQGILFSLLPRVPQILLKVYTLISGIIQFKIFWPEIQVKDSRVVALFPGILISSLGCPLSSDAACHRSWLCARVSALPLTSLRPDVSPPFPLEPSPLEQSSGRAIHLLTTSQLWKPQNKLMHLHLWYLISSLFLTPKNFENA